MGELTLKQYVTAVNKSKLIPTDQLQGLINDFVSKHKGQPMDWRTFARILVQKELLTSWQNQKLMKGRYKGFFLGKYKLLNLLGSGGMSTVYLAEHTVMVRRVALKILPRQLVEDTDHLERFYAESQAIAALDHPNIVRAYDVDNEGDVHYLVMEYVDGPDLEKLVEKEGALDYEIVADYIHQAAEGLAHAHSKNMIHRDIKPANLLVTNEGAVKILDMGLALLTDYEKSNDDHEESNVMGTTDYIAPEQALGTELDHRADIYSLGGTMYYLLTGSVPFPASTLAEVLLAHQTKQPVPIKKFRQDVPGELSAICLKMMAKKPKDRYQSAAEVSEALLDWLNDQDAWDGEDHTQRSEEEEAALTGFLDQVNLDHLEKKHRPEQDSSELTDFLRQQRSDDTIEVVVDDEMASFLSTLKTVQDPALPAPSGATPAPSKPKPTRQAKQTKPAPKPQSQPAKPAEPSAEAKPKPKPQRTKPKTSNPPQPEEEGITSFLSSLGQEEVVEPDDTDENLNNFLSGLGQDEDSPKRGKKK